MVRFISTRWLSTLPILCLLATVLSPAACAPIAPRPTRLSLISFFEPTQLPSQDFLTSIQAQVNVLDLHIVQLVQRVEDCEEEAGGQFPYNVQRSCMTRSILVEKISETLCEQWACEEDKEKRVHARVGAVAASTGSFEIFQPLFGLVLRDSLSQGSHWGWLQANTRVGDLESLFPFDLLHRFDIITYLTNPQDAIHLDKAITIMRRLPFTGLVAGAEEFASSSAFLAVQSSGTFSSDYWTQRLLHSSESRLNWIAVTQGLSKASESSAISLHGKRLLHTERDTAVVEVLRKPRAYSTFTPSGEISPLQLREAKDGEPSCTSTDAESRSQFCPSPSSSSWHHRIYYMKVLGQLVERKEPLALEDQFSKPEEVLFAPSSPYAFEQERRPAGGTPMLVLQT